MRNFILSWDWGPFYSTKVESSHFWLLIAGHKRMQFPVFTLMNSWESCMGWMLRLCFAIRQHLYLRFPSFLQMNPSFNSLHSLRETIIILILNNNNILMTFKCYSFIFNNLYFECREVSVFNLVFIAIGSFGLLLMLKKLSDGSVALWMAVFWERNCFREHSLWISGTLKLLNTGGYMCVMYYAVYDEMNAVQCVVLSNIMYAMVNEKYGL